MEAYFNPYKCAKYPKQLEISTDKKKKHCKVKVCFLVGYIYGFSHLADFEGNCRNIFICSKNINIDAVELNLYTESMVDIIMSIEGKRLYHMFISQSNALLDVSFGYECSEHSRNPS